MANGEDYCGLDVECAVAKATGEHLKSYLFASDEQLLTANTPEVGAVGFTVRNGKVKTVMFSEVTP